MALECLHGIDNSLLIFCTITDLMILGVRVLAQYFSITSQLTYLQSNREKISQRKSLSKCESDRKVNDARH